MENIKNILNTVFEKLTQEEVQEKTKLLKEWPVIAGEKLENKTKPHLTARGTLWVSVVDSALAYEVSQKHKMSLLKRTQAVLGEEKVKEIKVRVGQIN